MSYPSNITHPASYHLPYVAIQEDKLEEVIGRAFQRNFSGGHNDVQYRELQKQVNELTATIEEMKRGRQTAAPLPSQKPTSIPTATANTLTFSPPTHLLPGHRRTSIA